jgi:hypothetical protein
VEEDESSNGVYVGGFLQVVVLVDRRIQAFYRL